MGCSTTGSAIGIKDCGLKLGAVLFSNLTVTLLSLVNPSTTPVIPLVLLAFDITLSPTLKDDVGNCSPSSSTVSTTTGSIIPLSIFFVLSACCCSTLVVLDVASKLLSSFCNSKCSSIRA